jgi:hypothetical protein
LHGGLFAIELSISMLTDIRHILLTISNYCLLLLGVARKALP